MDEDYYLLPVDLRQDNKWVCQNDAEVGFSELKVTSDYIFVPRHIYEDSLTELPIDPIMSGDIFYVYPRSKYKQIQKTRRESYWACQWYLTLSLPTAPSIIQEYTTLQQLKTKIDQHLPTYPFIRLCSMSSKDIGIPIFRSTEAAILGLQNSERTKDFIPTLDTPLSKPHHIMLRQERNFDWEARCFWSKDKLRAVSLSEAYDQDKEKAILQFFNIWKYEIPYHSAIIDLGMTQDGVELIEFNPFGPDLTATAGRFSWYEDIETLLLSPKPVFRGDDTYI